MRIALANSPLLRYAALTLLTAAVILFDAAPASALVIENETGTTVPPADDPGWNYVSTVSQNFVYLGDGWALSAVHVGLPTGGLNFNGQSFDMITGQEFTVKNPSGSGYSLETDLRMVRINGDPGLEPINIASSQINEGGAGAVPLNQREVTIIGRGPAREDNQTRWNVTTVNSGNDTWTESPTGTYIGYKADSSDSQKRWGTNLIADEDQIFGGNDIDLRGNLSLTIGGTARNIISMVTQFDASGLTNEAQAVSGDSGSSVFYKRNGAWELIGIVNAVLSPINTDGQPTSIAVYGGFTTFADLSFYRTQILDVMNANPDYSVMGDIDLDGVVSGIVTPNGLATDDIAAFVSGWGYDNGIGVGTITSWKNGDLNHDGKTDYSDFVLLRTALNPSGGNGGLSFESLFGGSVVPEPAGLLIALVGLGFFALFRHRRQA